MTTAPVTRDARYYAAMQMGLQSVMRLADSEIDDLIARAEKAEAAVARVRSYAKDREAYGQRGRVVHSARIATDLLAIVDNEGV